MSAAESAGEALLDKDHGPAAEPAPIARGSLELYEDGDMPDLEDALASAAALADSVLRRMPPGLADARRLVSVELWTLPRPEEVQLLVRLGEEQDDTGARRPFVRRLIALRLVTELEGRAFWDASTIDPDEIRLRADRLRELLFLLAELSDELDPKAAPAAGLSSRDREQLGSVLKVLQPKRETLLAAAILGPALGDLIDWGATGELASMVPSVTAQEQRLFPREGSAEPPVARPLRRTCLEVAALRWLIHDDFAAWEGLELAVEGEAHDDEGRIRIRHGARDHEIAYRVVSERLQALQNVARRTGQTEQAEFLDSFRSSLQTSHEQLSTILKRPAAGEGEDVEGASQLSIEFGGDGEGTSESVDQVIGRAVSDASPAPGSAAAAQERARSAGVRHNWWRIAGMTGITAVLATIAVLLQIYKPQGPPPPIDFSPSDATNVIALTETSSIGSMLYARVSPLWNQMTDQERLKQVESLGRLARDRRFEAILLVNDQGEPLAEWTTKTGAELKSPAR